MTPAKKTTATTRKKASPKKAKSLVFCSGKFYYDLIKAREEKNRNDIAIIRIEQLYPFPNRNLETLIATYEHVNKYILVQHYLKE